MARDVIDRAERESDPEARKIATSRLVKRLWKLYEHLKSIGSKAANAVLRRIGEINRGQLRRPGPDRDEE